MPSESCTTENASSYRLVKGTDSSPVVYHSVVHINERSVVKGNSKGDGKRISRSRYLRSAARAILVFKFGEDWGQEKGSCSSCLGRRLETTVPLRDFTTSQERLLSVEPIHFKGGLRYIIILSLDLQKLASLFQV